MSKFFTVLAAAIGILGFGVICLFLAGIMVVTPLVLLSMAAWQNPTPTVIIAGFIAVVMWCIWDEV